MSCRWEKPWSGSMATESTPALFSASTIILLTFAFMTLKPPLFIAGVIEQDASFHGSARRADQRPINHVLDLHRRWIGRGLARVFVHCGQVPDGQFAIGHKDLHRRFIGGVKAVATNLEILIEKSLGGCLVVLHYLKRTVNRPQRFY